MTRKGRESMSKINPFELILGFALVVAWVAVSVDVFRTFGALALVRGGF